MAGRAAIVSGSARGGFPPIQATSSRPGSSMPTIAIVTVAESSGEAAGVTRSTTAVATKQGAPLLSFVSNFTSVSIAHGCFVFRANRRSRSSG